MSLNVTRFKSAEYARSIWFASAEHGTTAAKLLEPAYWANVAQNLKPGDRIEVETESREWLAELYVLESGAGFARVALLRFEPLNETQSQSPVPADADFSVEWKGPVRKWCVIRKIDKAALYEQLPSKDAAYGKLAAHIKPVAA